MAKHNMTNWMGPIKKTAYIYYQGIRDTQVQACRLVGNQSIGTTTGEIATFKKPALCTIPREQLWLYPEINEINRYGRGILSRMEHWINRVQVIRPQNSTELDYKPLYPQDERGSVDHYSLMLSKSSLGQNTDIEAHAKKYSSLVKQRKEIENIVLYGVSRGAATTFSALAEHQYKQIKLCVLEGPPASIGDVIKHYISNFFVGFFYNQLLAPIFFGKFHKVAREHQAIGHIAQFPIDVPLVVISSQKDGLVPHRSSMKLALMVAEKRIAAERQGKSVAPVYFLQLDDSGHNDYTVFSKSKDSLRYQNALHAIYKIHALPYIDKYAQAGEKELLTAELTKGILQQQVRFQSQFIRNRPARKLIRTEAFELVQKQLKQLSAEEQQRTINLCNAMPLYNRHRNPFSFFGKTATQVKLEQLTPNSKQILTQITT